MKKLLTVMLVLALVLPVFANGSKESASAPAKAGWLPEKDVQCIIPFAPGGGSDLLTRAIMKYVDLNGHTMVGVNVDGGSGLLGAEQAADAKADGYTILAHNAMNILGNGLSGVSDVWEDLVPLGFVVTDWNCLFTNKESGIKSVDDLVAYAKKNPGKLKWGLTNAAITVADSKRAMAGLGIDCTIVPYNGGADSITALLGDHIQLLLATGSECKAYIESGDFVPLFAIGTERCPVIPNTPTLKELGVAVDDSNPRGYYAPKGTPDEAVQFYSKMLKDICENPAFLKDLENIGFTCVYVSADDANAQQLSWYEGLKPYF